MSEQTTCLINTEARANKLTNFKQTREVIHHHPVKVLALISLLLKQLWSRMISIHHRLLVSAQSDLGNAFVWAMSGISDKL